MNRQQIQNEIESALQSDRVGNQIVTLAVHAGEATLHVLQADGIAGSFTHIQYRPSAMNQLASGDLTRFAETLSARLTYLLEPISTTETDRDVAQLRSDPPSREDSRTRCYFELLARSESLQLVRYRKTAGEPRQIVPMRLTHEVLARLLEDFGAAVSP